MIAPIVVGTIPVLTALMVWLGPAAHPPSPDAGLSPNASRASLQEPTDRAVLIVWIAAAVLLACVFTMPRVRTWVRWSPGSHVRRLAIWGALPGALLVAAGFIYSRNIANLMPEVRLTDVVAGSVIAALLVMLGMSSGRWRTPLNVVAIAGALALFLPLVVQFPDQIGDPFHAPTTFGELLAVAGGAVPMHDVFPQYTFLLGYPIAPLVRAFPADAVAITTWWVVGLQIVSLAAAIATVIWAGGRRVAAAAFVLVPALAFTAGQANVDAFTYFGVNPLRTVLPAIAIAVACWALFDPLRHGYSTRCAVAGAVAGLAALNNPDYGLPVAVVIIATALIVAAPRTRARSFAFVAGGAVGPAVIFALGAWAGGAAIHPADYLLLPRVFGSAGYVNVPMPALGLHVGAVVLFITAFVLGIALLASTRARRRSRRARYGLTLTLVGGWSLLTMPYYAGRSLAPTLLGGYALQIGWTVACLYALIVIGVRAMRSHRGALTPAFAFSVVVGCAALAAVAFGLVNVSRTDGWQRPGGVDLNPNGAVLADALATAPAPVADAVRAGRLAQVVGVPALTALTTGIPSASAFSQPELILVGPLLAYRQCQVLAATEAAYVVIPTSVEASLASVPLCRMRLGFASAIRFGRPAAPATEPPFTALPVRPS